MTLCVKTLSPFQIPFELVTGFNDRSEDFHRLLKAIRTKGGEDFFIRNQKESEESDEPDTQDEREYTTIDEDERELRLFSWIDREAEHAIRFHIFPNGIAIAETCLTALDETDAKILEDAVQAISKQQIETSRTRFLAIVKGLIGSISNPLLKTTVNTMTAETTPPKIFWTARALMLLPGQLKDAETQTLLTRWLANTQRPEDARSIVEGKRRESMTWLNYALVTDDIESPDDRVDTMILAQYCYTAQDACNLRLKEAIADAYREGRILEARDGLEQGRITARLHRVAVNEQINYLTRRKRKLLEEIFEAWEYDELVENGQRMIEICSGRLEEANRRRATLSARRTDFLLAAISLFTVFELFLFLTQFSRELVSQPILEYQDDGPSFFLSRIARLDMDFMFAAGAVVTLILILIYRFVIRK